MNNVIKIIEEFEGLKLKAYICPAGVPTIGYGTTVYPDGVKVGMADEITKEEACKFLDHDLEFFINYVKAKLKVEVEQHELDALVSFAYNLGTKHVCNLISLINAGLSKDVPNEMKYYRKAGGKILKGLIRRRMSEAKLFTGKENFIISYEFFARNEKEIRRTYPNGKKEKWY